MAVSHRSQAAINRLGRGSTVASSLHNKLAGSRFETLQLSFSQKVCRIRGRPANQGMIIASCDERAGFETLKRVMLDMATGGTHVATLATGTRLPDRGQATLTCGAYRVGVRMPGDVGVSQPLPDRGGYSD